MTAQIVGRITGMVLSLGFTALAFTHPSVTSNLQKLVVQVIEEAGYAPKDVGVFVKMVTDDSALVSINADRDYIPASITKLVTGAAALELLGLKYRFATSLYHDGRFDRLKGDIEGNLYIKGGGDPGFSAERLWLLVQHLTHIGVKSIKEDLILDDFFFDGITTGPGYEEDQTSRAYDAPVSALSANFNTIAVHVAPGGKIGAPVRITEFPKVDGVRIISTAKTVGARRAGPLRVKTTDRKGATAIVASGTMGISEAPRYVYRRTWQTWKHFGNIMTALFKQCGIEFSGSLRHYPVPDSIVDAGALYTFESEPIIRFVENMFKYSSNFAAEMLFKTVAAEYDSLPGSWESGAAVLQKWWAERNLPGTLSVVNGSGMGRTNRLSPGQVAALLEYAHDRPTYSADYLSALSIAGYDGTLESRFTRSPLKGVVRGKTGTLNSCGASNLAGYMLPSGERCIFAILINSSKISQYSHWVTQRKILETVLKAVNKERLEKSPFLPKSPACK
ncbi:MAG: D-alanyl-D-alanine carboxypeptidase/D-alanyl-D-alanine-endopeptidase [Chitinivibrionales bacterium]|nr:D-alanyl-D-alanine carboxypeptidase/D-alanyl-D-alanine-endopeptidase [Chitinivibrionales bacterium]MBD3358805.1 D-alanyl-D-alanine carboxypeptidase/D-alanyl-D-alanine-endopeptidase [Chitinivibrionales bacterium]